MGNNNDPINSNRSPIKPMTWAEAKSSAQLKNGSDILNGSPRMSEDEENQLAYDIMTAHNKKCADASAGLNKLQSKGPDSGLSAAEKRAQGKSKNPNERDLSTEIVTGREGIDYI